MFQKIGLGELFMLLLLLVLPFWRIFRKAGFNGALSLLIFIPGVNLLLLLFLAFTEWPVERELRRLRGE